MKMCSRCKKTKVLTGFHKKPTSKDGLAAHCIMCHSIYTKNHYERNKEYYLKKAHSMKFKHKKYIDELKSTTPCKDCNKYWHSWQLDFDHLIDKCFTISREYDKISFKRLKEEIAKCEIVCANCHRDRTHKRMFP